ncbi:MAG TPA: O-antigen ligase family protein [Caulobacteraceae bacterium]|nr:O-antigen ligase family protein [Caulobacteraceae bacterium]
MSTVGWRGGNRRADRPRTAVELLNEWRASRTLAALAVVALPVIGHLLFGAAGRAFGLGLAAVACLLTAGLLIACRWARASLAFDRTDVVVAGLFLLVLLIGVLQLTPFAPGGAHPLWGYVGAEAAGTIDRSATFAELLKLSGLGALFAAAVALGRSGRATDKFMIATLAALGVFSGLMLLAFLADPGGIYGLERTDTGPRFAAAFSSANSAAALFGMGAALAAASLAVRFSRAGSPQEFEASLPGASLEAAAFALCTVALAATASRAGMIAAAAGAGLAVFWALFSARSGGGRRWLWGALALVVALSALFLAGSDLLLGRLGSIGEDFETRRRLFGDVWTAFLEAPLSGYGLGSFDAVNTYRTTSESYPYAANVGAAHNVYLEWLLTAGVVGAGAMFLTLGVVLSRIAGAAAGRRNRVALAVIGASAAVLLHGATDYALQEYSIALFWATLLGLGYGAASRRGR